MPVAESEIEIAPNITMAVREVKSTRGAVRPLVIIRGKGMHAYFSPTEAAGLLKALQQLDSEGLFVDD